MYHFGHYNSFNCDYRSNCRSFQQVRKGRRIGRRDRSCSILFDVICFLFFFLTRFFILLYSISISCVFSGFFNLYICYLLRMEKLANPHDFLCVLMYFISDARIEQGDNPECIPLVCGVTLETLEYVLKR